MKNIQRFKDWLLEDEKSSRTCEGYIRAVKQFFSAFDEISKTNMIAYKSQIMEKWAPKTVNVRITALNQYCKYIGHPEYCIKQIKMPRTLSLENVISIEEYNTIVGGLLKDGKFREYWIIRFLAQTGARASELIQMDKEGLNRGYMETWNKGRIRRNYIPDQLRQDSKEYFRDTEGLLFRNWRGKPLTTRGLANIIKRQGNNYGIRKEVLYPHSFRHLFAIQFMRHDSDISLLADLMGHVSASTTAIYTRLSAKEQRERLNKAMDW